MKKILLVVPLFIVLSGCASSTDLGPREIAVEFNNATFTPRQIDACKYDCIDNEKELKDQLQIMIDTLDMYLLENGYALEGCVGDSILRGCYENVNSKPWSIYLNHRDDLVELLDKDYEYDDGGMWSSYIIDLCSGLHCPTMFPFGLYMDENVLRIVSGMGITVYKYTDGFTIENYTIEKQNITTSSSDIYQLIDDNTMLELYYYKHEGVMENKTIKLQNNNLYLELLYVLDDENEVTTKVYSDEKWSYSYTDSDISIFSVESNEIHIHHQYSRLKDDLSGYSSTGGDYNVRINALLLDNWDNVVKELDETSEHWKTNVLYDGDTVIDHIGGYEFDVYKYNNAIELWFSVDDQEMEEFISTIDSELHLHGEESIAYLFNTLNEFVGDPESFINTEAFEYRFDDAYFEEFFGIE